MKKAKNLYMCRSPLQLLNCIEAREKMGQAGAEDIIFCAWRAEPDKQLMLRLLKIYPHWSEVYFLPLYPIKNQISALINIFWKTRHFSNLFVGDTTHLINIFINKVGTFGSIHLVDDGTATHSLAQRIGNRTLHKTRKNGTPRGKINSAIQAHLGMSQTFLYRAKIFTLYQIDSKNPKNEVIPNELTFTKAIIGKKPRSKEIWFIGSNIRKSVLNDEIDYIELLKQVNRSIDLSQVVYIPHRKETSDHLSQIAVAFNMEIRRLNNIIELELANVSALPESFISFGSSALDTIDIIAKTPTTVFCIPEDSIKEKSIPAYREMYKSFSEKGFKIIKMAAPKLQ